MSEDPPPAPRKGLRSLAARIGRLMSEKQPGAVPIAQTVQQAPPVEPRAACSPPPPDVLSKFDADEIEVLRKIYKELNSRSSNEGIDRETFVQYFPLPSLWGDRLFQYLDTKSLGRVNYCQLMTGLALCCRGTKSERMKVLFHIFDLNGDGRISRDELTLLLSCVPMAESILQAASRAPTGTLSRQASKTNVCTDGRYLVDGEPVTQGAESSAAPGDAYPLEEFLWRDRARLRSRRRPSGASESSFSSSLDSQLRGLWLPAGEESDPLLTQVQRFCSNASWRTSPSLSSPREVTTASHQPEMPSSMAESVGDTEEHYIVGAGPSPMIAELLAETSEGVGANDVEALVSKIIENYDASEENSLSFAEFRSFMEHHPKFLRLISECLREEVWGLHGHALYRPQRQAAGSSFAASLLPSARPTRPASVVSARPEVDARAHKLTLPQPASLLPVNPAAGLRTSGPKSNSLSGSTCGLTTGPTSGTARAHMGEAATRSVTATLGQCISPPIAQPLLSQATPQSVAARSISQTTAQPVMVHTMGVAPAATQTVTEAGRGGPGSGAVVSTAADSAHVEGSAGPLDTMSVADESTATGQQQAEPKCPMAELVQLEKWIKLQSLFNQAAPSQQSPTVFGASAHAAQKPPAGPGAASVAQSTSQKAADAEGRCLADARGEAVYPRHSRYAGSREVLDFLEVSLKPYESEDEEASSKAAFVEDPRPAKLWKEKREALSCPNCQSPLLVCPTCDRRFPVLRMSGRCQLSVECVSCAQGEVKRFTSCWICQWPFSKAMELLDRHDVLQEGVLWKCTRQSTGQIQAIPRHFVLVDKLLYYYARQDDCIPKGFVFLEGCYVDPIAAPFEALPLPPSPKAQASPPANPGGGNAASSAGSVAAEEPRLTPPRMYGFCIIHSSGKFGRRDLYAPDEGLRDQWIAALRATMNQQPINQLFTLHEIIGQGKFSLVYRATEIATNSEYAVKVINKSRMSGHEKELLRSEMSIMRLLRHPHVIFLKSLVASRDVLHIIMELVPGGELFDAIASRQRVSEVTVHRLTSQLLRTLIYLHKSGIIHRDLKPENVLLTSRNVDDADVKIADFGLSCVCGPTEKLYQPCGTLVYVAPEVLTLQGYNHQVDLWSLGVIVYLLLCGRLPFPVLRGAGVAVLTDREKFYTPKFDLPAWKAVSRSAQDFIRRLLEIDPAKRLTAQEALNHIWIKNPTAVLKDVSLKPMPQPIRNDDEAASTGSGTVSLTASGAGTGGGQPVQPAQPAPSAPSRSSTASKSVVAPTDVVPRAGHMIIQTGSDEDEKSVTSSVARSDSASQPVAPKAASSPSTDKGT